MISDLFQPLLNYFSLSTVTILIVTFGVISINLMLSSFLSIKLINNNSTFFHLQSELMMGIIFLLSIILLNVCIPTINSHGIPTVYRTNSIILLLLTTIFACRQKSVKFINIGMPILFLIVSIYPQHSLTLNLKLTYLNLLFLIFIVFVYHYSNTILNNHHQFFIVKNIFGLFWLIDTYAVVPFNFYYLPFLLIELIVMSFFIRKYQITLLQIAKEYRHLNETIRLDPLTKVDNRLSFDDTSRIMEDSWQEISHRRLKGNLYMALVDIDYFKKINDQYGHLAGDLVLKQIAAIMKNDINQTNGYHKIFRFGGEEFVIIFHAATALKAHKIIEQMKEDVDFRPLYINEHEIKVTISVGVSKLQTEDKTFIDFFNRVDNYMYNSKRQRKNKLSMKE